MIVVGIPYVEIDSDKRAILNRCVSSLKGQDVVIVVGKQETLAKAQNMLLEMGFGMGADYVIISNDDVILDIGTLDLLCRPGEIVSPVVHGGIDKLFHAHMFCIPKTVYEKIGGFDETCPGAYYIDSDMWIRFNEAEIPVVKLESVHINHPEPGRTLEGMSQSMQDCREWFVTKHGSGATSLVE